MDCLQPPMDTHLWLDSIMKKEQILQVVAENVKKLMDSHGSITSQEKLARASGVSQSSISRVMRADTRATIKTVYEISCAFRVPMSQIVDPKAHESKTFNIAQEKAKYETLQKWPFPITYDQYQNLDSGRKRAIEDLMKSAITSQANPPSSGQKKKT